MNKRATALVRLFETAHAGVYVGTLGQDHSLTLAANPHLKLILGYPVETPDAEIRPFDPQRFIDAQARGALWNRLNTDGSVADYLLRLRRADNLPIWVEVTARGERLSATELSASPDALRVEALIRDVSERKKLDKDARAMYQELLQAEKMASLGQTVSGVAHELNNPLATILSCAERLSRSGTLDASLQRGLETIRRESERAARIVRNLLTFARKRQSTRAMVDLNDVVRETLSLRAYEQRISNITVIQALASGLPSVFADGHQVQQVLLNLMINAEQAMLAATGCGTLIVRTWFDAEQESIVLEINDDGPGIPEEHQAKIFDPFFTTKEVGKGTGLGLTVAYAIVQEHGGRIRLESHPAAGTSFYIELPVSGASVPVVLAAPSVGPAAPVAGASVLIVEDEDALAAAVIDALRDAGYIVERAGDGEEALARVKQQVFDAVICDLKMPRVDGKTFYRLLTLRLPGLARRVVFVTGDVVGAEGQKFLEESGCRWLAKPFRLAELVRAISDTLA